MVERPERQVDAFAKAGADRITVHAEATPHVHYALQRDPRARAAAPGSRSTRARRRTRSPSVDASTSCCA